MRSTTLRAAAEQVAPAPKKPWLIFLFLGGVFFVKQHDWFFSLKAGVGFATPVDDMTAVISQGNLLAQMGLVSLGVYAIASLIWKRQCQVTINGSLGWLILFFLTWIFLSLAWSDDSARTVRKLTALAMLILGAFAVSKGFSPRQLVLWVFFSTAGYLLVGLAAELLLGTFSPLTRGYRFAGTLHPNHQGLNCASLFFASLFLIAGEKRWRGIFVVTTFGALVFLFLTKSRTSLFSTATALLFYWVLSLRLSRRFALLLCTIMVVCIALLLSDYSLPIFTDIITLDRLDSDTLTLTGRLPLWGELLSYISGRLIQGYGYDSFWTARRVAEVSTWQSWAVIGGDCAYLDVVLGLGLVGGIIYVLIIAVGIGRAIVARTFSRNSNLGFVAVVLIFAAVHGITESAVIQGTYLTFVIMVALAGLGFSYRDQTEGMWVSWRQ
jgi:O-antigen ligase